MKNENVKADAARGGASADVSEPKGKKASAAVKPKEKKSADNNSPKPKEKKSADNSNPKPKEKKIAGEVYTSAFEKLRVPICFAAILLVSVAAVACLVSEVVGSVSVVTGDAMRISGDPINAVSYLVILITGMTEGMQSVEMFFSVVLTIAAFASLGMSVTAVVLGIRALLPGGKSGGLLLKIAMLNIIVNGLVMAIISMTANISPFAANNVSGYMPSSVLIGGVIVSSALLLYVKITDIIMSGKIKEKMFIFDLAVLGVKLALAVAVICVISTTGVLTVAVIAAADGEFFAYVFGVLMLLAVGAAADAIIFYSFKLADFRPDKQERKKEFIFNFISVGLMFLVFCFAVALEHVVDFQNTFAVNIIGNSVIVMILSGISLGVLLIEKTLRAAEFENQGSIAAE